MFHKLLLEKRGHCACQEQARKNYNIDFCDQFQKEVRQNHS